MALFGVVFFRWINPDTKPNLLGTAFHFPQLYFWQQKSAQEVCVFAGREIVGRLQPGDCKSLKYTEYLCHVRIISCGEGIHLGCAVMTDEQYPARVVNSFIMKTTGQFLEAHPPKELAQYQGKDVALDCPAVEELLVAYQKPEEADPVMRLEKKLGETREELFESIDALLRRGEKLQDLSEASADLSYKSKAFLRHSEDLNKWCPGCVLF